MTDAYLFSELASSPAGTMLIWAQENADNSGAAANFDEEEAQEATRLFLQHGLISEDFPVSGPWDLTARGRRIAKQLAESRRSGPLRRAAVQKALLRLVDDTEAQYTDDIIGTDVEGDPVTEREHTHAVAALHRWGLMEGSMSFGNGGLNSPEVTPLGREAADDPRPPIDFVNNGGTTIYDNSKHLINHGQVGAAAVGEQVSQSDITFNASNSEASEILAQIKAQLEHLLDVPEEAWPAFNKLEEEAQSTATTTSRLHAGYGAFMGAIAAKLGDESYSGLRDLVAALGSTIANA